jgi:hypothetical protein
MGRRHVRYNRSLSSVLKHIYLKMHVCFFYLLGLLACTEAQDPISFVCSTVVVTVQVGGPARVPIAQLTSRNVVAPARRSSGIMLPIGTNCASHRVCAIASSSGRSPMVDVAH